MILESSIGSGTTVGPFAYLRPHTKVGAGCKVGDFVEMKNSSFGDGSKAAHLTYVGDADVGSGVNLGCGVVFVNYDGTHKYRAQVGDDVFVGCNSNLDFSGADRRRRVYRGRQYGDGGCGGRRALYRQKPRHTKAGLGLCQRDLEQKKQSANRAIKYDSNNNDSIFMSQ